MACVYITSPFSNYINFLQLFQKTPLPKIVSSSTPTPIDVTKAQLKKANIIDVFINLKGEYVLIRCNGIYDVKKNKEKFWEFTCTSIQLYYGGGCSMLTRCTGIKLDCLCKKVMCKRLKFGQVIRLMEDKKENDLTFKHEWYDCERTKTITINNKFYQNTIDITRYNECSDIIKNKKCILQKQLLAYLFIFIN